MDMQWRLAASASRVARVVLLATDSVGAAGLGAKELAATAAPSPSPMPTPLKRPASRLTACSYKRWAGAAAAATVVRVGMGLAASAGFVGGGGGGEAGQRAAPFLAAGYRKEQGV